MLALHALAVLAVLSCAWLGWWQLDRTRAFDAPTSDPAPAPLTSLTTPAGSLPDVAAGRLVTVSGTFDPEQQFSVANRRGNPWLLTVLRVGGAGVLVIRGQLATGAAVPPAPWGTIELVGRLSPAEPSAGAVAAGSNQLAAVSPVDLLSRVPYPLYDGYLVLSSSVPAADPGLALVPSPAVPDTPPGYVWQHAGYVALWWAFGLFAVFFWYRLVRDRMAEG